MKRQTASRRSRRGTRRPLNMALVLLIDVLIAGAALCVFALFDHVLPQSYGATETSAQAVSPFMLEMQGREQAPTAPLADDGQAEIEAPTVDEPEKSPEPSEESPSARMAGMFDFPGKFTNGEVEISDNSYRSANLNVTLTEHSYTSDYKGYKQSYYVLHIYVRDIRCLKSVFAQDTYGKGISEGFMSMVERTGAIGAINTDYYNFGRHPKAMLIRNGLLYGADVDEEYDLCVINFDGTMDVYKKGTSPDGYQLLESGAMHTFCFGPILLKDGAKLSEYDDVGRDPRTCIGMVEPGHYVFFVCEGRSSSAKGFTYKELANIMLGEGCTVAYNLDGGDSSQIAFCGRMVNTPSGNGRSLSDIFYVGEP